MSWWGFRDLQPGDSMDILQHLQFPFVVPAGLGGVAARPLIAGSSLVAVAFVLSAATG